MNNTIKFSVNIKNSGKRLDIFLAENIKQFTRSFLKKIIKNRQVKLNDKILSSPSIKVKYKDLIIIDIIVASLPTTAFFASISYQSLFISLFLTNLVMIAGLILIKGNIVKLY